MTRLALRNFRTALSYNGTSTWKVDLGTPAAMTALASAMTVAAWVKPSGRGGNGRLMSQWKSAGNLLHFDLAYGFTANKFAFYVSKTGAAIAQSAVSSTALDGVSWYFVVGVYDGANVMIYVNGVLETSNALTGNLFTGSTQPVMLGNSGDGSALTGLLDEPRIWSVALTAPQISSLYFQGIVPATGLLGEWKLDEGSGTSATDSSGNGNTGTITGATYTTDVPMIARSAA